MTKPPTMHYQEILKVRLQILQREHRDLDDAVHALGATVGADPLTMGRLKKQKLSLKDRISAIEDELTPDIIA